MSRTNIRCKKAWENQRWCYKAVNSAQTLILPVLCVCVCVCVSKMTISPRTLETERPTAIQGLTDGLQQMAVILWGSHKLWKTNKRDCRDYNSQNAQWGKGSEHSSVLWIVYFGWGRIKPLLLLGQGTPSPSFESRRLSVVVVLPNLGELKILRDKAERPVGICSLRRRRTRTRSWGRGGAATLQWKPRQRAGEQGAGGHLGIRRVAGPAEQRAADTRWALDLAVRGEGGRLPGCPALPFTALRYSLHCATRKAAHTREWPQASDQKGSWRRGGGALGAVAGQAWSGALHLTRPELRLRGRPSWNPPRQRRRAAAPSLRSWQPPSPRRLLLPGQGQFPHPLGRWHLFVPPPWTVTSSPLCGTLSLQLSDSPRMPWNHLYPWCPPPRGEKPTTRACLYTCVPQQATSPQLSLIHHY